MCSLLQRWLEIYLDFGSLLFYQVDEVVWGLLTLISLWTFLWLETSTGNNIQTGNIYLNIEMDWIKLCRYLTFHQFLVLLLTEKQLGWRTRKKRKKLEITFGMISPLRTNCKILPTGLQIIESFTLAWSLPYTNSHALPWPPEDAITKWVSHDQG